MEVPIGQGGMNKGSGGGDETQELPSKGDFTPGATDLGAYGRIWMRSDSPGVLWTWNWMVVARQVSGQSRKQMTSAVRPWAVLRLSLEPT